MIRGLDCAIVRSRLPLYTVYKLIALNKKREVKTIDDFTTHFYSELDGRVQAVHESKNLQDEFSRFVPYAENVVDVITP